MVKRTARQEPRTPEIYWGKEFTLDSYSCKPHRMLYLFVEGNLIAGHGRDGKELARDLLFSCRCYAGRRNSEVIDVNCAGNERKRVTFIDGYWGRLPVPCSAIVFRRLRIREREELQKIMDRLARKDKRPRVQLVV